MWLAGVVSAVRFLTVLPLGRGNHETNWLSVASFPFVGLCLGVLAAATDRVLEPALSPLVRSALVLALLAFLSGGLHLDGLMDSFDGLFGGHDPEQRLSIMRDSRLGSYGAVAAICVVLVQWACLSELHTSWRGGGIVGASVLGRWAMVYALAAFPYARPAGLGLAFKAVAGVAALLAATAFTLVVLWLLLGPAAAGLLVLVWLSTWLMANYALRRVPGLTGDLYGALCELSAMLVMVGAVLLQGLGPRTGPGA